MKRSLYHIYSTGDVHDDCTKIVLLPVNTHLFIRANLISVFVCMLFLADVDNGFPALSPPSVQEYLR